MSCQRYNSPHSDPLADLLIPGSSLWYTLDSKNHATVVMGHAWVSPKTVPNFQISAHGVDLCVGCSLRCVTVDLNRVNACHRELLRFGVHLEQAIESLGPSPAFPYAFPLACGASSFHRSRFDCQISGCCPQTDGDPSVSRWLTINFPRDLSFARSVDLHERVSPNSAVPTCTAPADLRRVLEKLHAAFVRNKM